MAKPRIDAFIDALLSTHAGDPANARYLNPLDDPEQEAMARSMADWIYSARAENFCDDITKEQPDALYEQTLIDSRHMLLDDDYARIFEE